MNLSFNDLVEQYDSGDTIVVCIRDAGNAVRYAGKAKIGCDGTNIWTNKHPRKFPLDSGMENGVFSAGVRKKARKMTFHASEDDLDDDAKEFIRNLAQAREKVADESARQAAREEALAKAEAERKARQAVIRGRERSLTDLVLAGDARRSNEDVDLEGVDDEDENVLDEEQTRLYAQIDLMSDHLTEAAEAAQRFVEKVLELGFDADEIKTILKVEYGHSGKLIDAAASLAAARG